MNHPFKVFPTTGYRNTQFHVISNVDNLELTLFRDNEEIQILSFTPENHTIITKLEGAGTYKAICETGNVSYEQTILVKDAYRLGTSEFKTAFVFDDIDISFFLMKDRMLLYNEETNNLFTENGLSPTEIRKINNDRFLFVTRIGTKSNGITDFGVYNINNFEIKGELLNQYDDILILENHNKLWARDIRTNEIICFKILNSSGTNFKELKRIDNVSYYEINKTKTHIFIDTGGKILLINLTTLNEKTLDKSPSTAIDKKGFYLQINEEIINCTNGIINYKSQIPRNFDDIHIESDNYLHIGEQFKTGDEEDNFIEKVHKVSNEEIHKIAPNKFRHYVGLPENEIIENNFSTHKIYPTIGGIYFLTKTNKVKLKGIIFKKDSNDEWRTSPYTSNSVTYKLEFISSTKSKVIINETSSFRVVDYNNLTLIIRTNNKHLIFQGLINKQFDGDSSFTVYNYPNRGHNYILEKNDNLYSLYNIKRLKHPILNKVEIHNDEYIQEQSVIWYSGNSKLKNRHTKYLKGYSLLNGFHIGINESRAHHSIYKNASDYNFKRVYIESSNKIIINPQTAEIKGSILGNVISTSKDLNKIITRRGESLYLQVYSPSFNKYEAKEVQIKEHGYKESYLSPDGKYLVLSDNSNEYFWYNIEKGEKVKFLSGNFLSFSKEGNLILEDDTTRAVKIIDPLTFSDITPPNYHHYRFLSPDGKLYSQVSKNTRYFDKVEDKYVDKGYVSQLRNKLDKPNKIYPTNDERQKEYEHKKQIAIKNRRKYFKENQSKLENINIENSNEINSHKIIKIERYTEIGIVGTDEKVEILFPEDLKYFNYAAFSYDNEYFGYVGKPSINGIVHLFQLDFDTDNNTLSIVSNYISRKPKYASWVCGFSKTGYFATYDSTPDTYIVKCDDKLFETKTVKDDLIEGTYRNKSSLYQTFNNWKKINGKNFLSFSPSGNYLALSEQGYEPLTMGGYGHQESGVIHIAQTETGKIIDSFLDHGEKIKDDQRKKVTFVAFSEDESRIMSMSADGVVIIRNIELNDNDENKDI